MPYKNCLNCEKIFYTRPSTIKKGFGKYCSKTCSNTHNNPSLSRRIPKEIEDKIIEAYLSGLSKKKAGEKYSYGREATDKILKRRNIKSRSISEALKGRKFPKAWREKISKNHHDISGKNNPMYGKKSRNSKGRGKSIFVPHLKRCVRSTWEAKIANLLLELNIGHEYEKHRIILDNYSTLIDFYLPEYNLFIEVKGFENEHFKIILKKLKELRPDIKLLIIRKTEYAEITKNPSVIIEYIKSFT